MSDYVELVTVVQQGDSAAFGELVVQFQDMAYFVALGYLGQQPLAQDATQEAFWEAYRCLTSLREPAAFPGWLRRIVHKQCDRLTRGQQATLLPLDDVPQLASDLSSPEAMLAQLQRRQAVQTAVNSLPEIYREVTKLFYLNGRSYQDIVQQLNLPLSTVKKRLHAARKMLKESKRLMTTQSYRPSQDDKLSNRIRFFIALKNADLLQIRQLLRQEPELLTTQTKWGAAADGWHWPLGITALHWAASIGNRPLAALLLEAGADVNIVDHSGGTPLHRAAHMGQIELAHWLLENGADPTVTANHQLTALHTAVIRNRPEIVKLLLDFGSDQAQKDSQERSALDWARLKELTAIAKLLGGTESEAAAAVKPPSTSQIWQTGIKVIDLIAPFKWGGRNGIFTPFPALALMCWWAN